MTRRHFVAASTLAGAALAAGCSSRRDEWEFLSEGQAANLAAVCDQIIPADDYPGASQAGVVRYIDHQLTGPYRRHQKTYTAGLRQVDNLCRSRFGIRLTDAASEQKLWTVRALEEQSRTFFELVRSHTMEGYYGSPRHGGNRDAASWHMLGLAEPPVRGRAQYDLSMRS
jgi:gluconate 2-dehydrogenase gamma chain